MRKIIVIILIVIGPFSFSQTVIKGTTNLYLDVSSGKALCDLKQTSEVVEITSPLTGVIWMDRNLGASHVAASSTDHSAYGCLFQWGRGNDVMRVLDGPQLRQALLLMVQQVLLVEGTVLVTDYLL